MRNNSAGIEDGVPVAARVPLSLVGESDAAVCARAALAAIARTPHHVMLACERGCRPREVAGALHQQSGCAGPFIAIDCSVRDAAGLTADLFGTPPIAAHAGGPLPADLEVLGPEAVLLRAGGGTLFLEEVGEIPAAVQRRLARVLRDGEAHVIGRSLPTTLSCRVVASGSPELAAEVRDGRFRPDLYRRLSADRITIPSLRLRPEDLPAIIEALVPSLDGLGRQPRSFTQPAVTVLAALPWAENIDELADLLARVLRQAGGVVRQEDVLMHLPIDGAFARLDLTASLREARQRFEREYIAAVLERHRWRMSEAARALGIERANLYRKTRQLGITRAARVQSS